MTVMKTEKRGESSCGLFVMHLTDNIFYLDRIPSLVPS
jgi:hypothetical protein